MTFLPKSDSESLGFWLAWLGSMSSQPWSQGCLGGMAPQVTAEELVLEEQRKVSGQANIGVHSSCLEPRGQDPAHTVITFKKKM